jgi:large subunit ribosomal protein L21
VALAATNAEIRDKSMQEQNTFGSYAIIQTGGKQYQAVPGKTLAIEKVIGNVGDTISFDQVLLRKTADGQVHVGTPFLSTPVTASILKDMKERKLVVYRFRRRQKVRVKRGHRQPKTIVRIEAI